ncbi:MAG: hypothetical protein KJ808_01785, partial [Acidobacteria bacterium]|nr:hypothetical protein [Acidobacteriota bacterium]MBU4307745.1 hypothetical protein [Acidobacteriota bacterium]MBU4404749.1 hypothetical protein [Acidobacteriota bacterium]
KILINQKILQSDDNNPFNLFHAFQLQGCFTYGDTRKGHKDKDKRENIDMTNVEIYSRRKK